MKTVYKVFRLIILTVIITYFIGTMFFYYSTEVNFESDHENGKTFVTGFGLQDQEDAYLLAVSSYFTITTLSTVGYGDFYPLSNSEKILAMGIMLIGVAFFSYVLN